MCQKLLVLQIFSVNFFLCHKKNSVATFFSPHNFFLFFFITIATVTTVTTVTNNTTVTTVTTITTNIVEYQMLLLYSSKGKFFTKIYQPTNQPTDRQTTRPIELLRAAKNHVN